MKLTDKTVAKALGWTEVRYRSTSHRGSPSLRGLKPGGSKTPKGIPAFTTSIDAIVAEIEARGLWHGYMAPPNMMLERGYSGTVAARTEGPNYAKTAYAKTPALALCAALLAYLKETK